MKYEQAGWPMNGDVERTLFHASTIQSRLDEIAQDIVRDYTGRDLTVVAVLSGSLMFAADLLRRVPLPLQLDCVSAASYHGGTESTGIVKIDRASMPDLAGRHVLVLDDILDSGRTLHAIREKLRAETDAASVSVCVLLRKRKTRARDVEAEYVGFDIDDEFVVGYGLDFRERYRNLPFIGVLRADVIDQA